MVQACSAANGYWPGEWYVPEEIPFKSVDKIRSMHMCTVAGEPVKQIDALLDALARSAARYAPSEAEMERLPRVRHRSSAQHQAVAQCRAG